MSIHYDFPVIRNISDVIPHIADKPEFVVVNKPELGITVINYVYKDNETFQTINNNEFAYSHKVRRECRGIIFDTKTGQILNRRLHKFFNAGERPDMVVNLAIPHVILEKLDGSMITPIYLPNDKIVWGTKAGVTDISEQATEFVNNSKYSNYNKFADTCRYLNVTPIFEWCSPKNKIVVNHTTDSLTLLHMRENNSGDYWNRDNVKKLASWFAIPVVQEFKNTEHTLSSFIDLIRKKEGEEGVVVCFEDGHMVKVKSEWYTTIHKVKDQIGSERSVARLILEERLDDVLPFLPQDLQHKLMKYRDYLWLDVSNFTNEVTKVFADRDSLYPTRREFAEFRSLWNEKALRHAVFALWTAYEKNPLVEKHLSVINWTMKFLLNHSNSNSHFNTHAKDIIRTTKWEINNNNDKE